MSHATLTGVAVTVTDRVPTAAVALFGTHPAESTHNQVGTPTYVVCDAPPFDAAPRCGNCNLAAARCANTAAGGSTTIPGGGFADQKIDPSTSGPGPMQW